MHDPTADTAVATGGSDDTEPSSPSGAPRIRPSRPRGSGADYEALSSVDPAHYVLQREIARGGMGRIHVARDRRLGRDVALKEVLVDDEATHRRFEREARITARLQHPSIVAVHEAGVWPSGEPFYAMRLVTGRSLDEAIAQAGALDARIALVPNVLAIADAMAYAHGQHIIHRDLKPKNVVVGEFGETVVIDWGLAKDLAADPSAASSSFERQAPPAATGGSSTGTSAPGETTVGDVLGTPAYMPPEQAAGKSVDERADVYAIGAILYHLLAGKAPYIGETKTALLTSVHVAPPPPLTVAAPGAPSELVAIVERAMAREPADRYATARALAEDLRRFQTGQLVGAHRYSTRQLLARWMRRHRTVLAGVAAALTVAVTIGVVSVKRIVAANLRVEKERAAAVKNQKKSEELMQFMVEDLAKRLTRAGRLDLIDSIAHRAAAYYDERGVESDDDQRLAAAARLGIGGVLEKRADLAGASIEFEKARVGFSLLAARHADYHYLVAMANLSFALARLEQGMGDLALAAMRVHDGLDAAQLAATMSPNGEGVTRAMLDGHRRLANIAESHGDLETSLAEFRQTLALARSESPPEDHAVAAKDELNAHSDLWRILRRRNELQAALLEIRETLRVCVAEAAHHPKDAEWLHDLAISHVEVGHTLIELKDYAGAETELTEGIKLIDRLVKIDPSNSDWADSRSSAYEKLGMLRFARKDYAGAGTAYRTAHDVAAELATRNPSNAELQRDESLMANKLGDVQLVMKDTAGAIATYRAALATRERLVAKDPNNMLWRRDLFYSHIKIGGALDEIPEQRRAAVDELKVALAIAEEIAARTPDNASSAADVAGSHEGIGEVLEHMHDLTGARAEYTTALGLARAIAARRPTTGQELVDGITARLAKLGKADTR